jgi:ABC-type dipeptide/oligopeptide/nickel transport system permease component
MTRLATIFHRRSLTLSFVALLFGFMALARIFNFAGLAHQHGREFVQQSLILCIVSFVVCIAVLANLVLDMRRGYSPSRCSLASVITLAAFAGPVLLTISLASYFLR